MGALCLHPMGGTPTAVCHGGASARVSLHSPPLTPWLPDMVTRRRAAWRGSWHPGKSYPGASLPEAPAMLGGVEALLPPIPTEVPPVPSMVREPGMPPRLREFTPQLREGWLRRIPSCWLQVSGWTGDGPPASRDLVRGPFGTLAWKIKTH